MAEFSQYDCFDLTKDLNPEIGRGITGVILEIYNDGEAYEVEFVKLNGSNYEYDGNATFTVDASYLKKAKQADDGVHDK